MTGANCLCERPSNISTLGRCGLHFADDTPLPVIDPGRGRTKTGRLWGYAFDDRPWNGSTPPACGPTDSGKDEGALQQWAR